MDLKIAIQLHEAVHRDGVLQPFSKRRAEPARCQGAKIVQVDVFSYDIILQIAACDSFMWRYPPSAHPLLDAARSPNG